MALHEWQCSSPWCTEPGMRLRDLPMWRHHPKSEHYLCASLQDIGSVCMVAAGNLLIRTGLELWLCCVSFALPALPSSPAPPSAANSR